MRPRKSFDDSRNWLSSEPRNEYEILMLSRRPITALVDAVLPADEAVVVKTYARDSIWNTDRRPVKPLPGVKWLSAHRLHGPADGQEALIKALAAKLRAAN